jgi:hypothetical protein
MTKKIMKYYIEERDKNNGNIIIKKKVAKCIIFYYDSDRIKFSNKVKEVLCEDGSIYHIINNQYFKKNVGNKYNINCWSNGEKKGLIYILVDNE